MPLAAAAAVYAGLSRGIPLSTLRTEGWLAILGPPRTFRNVYASYAGLDRPALRLAELALAAVVLLLVASLLPRPPRSRRGRRARDPGSSPPRSGSSRSWPSCARPPARLADSLSLFPPLVRVVPPLVVAAGLWRLVRRLPGRGSHAVGAVPDAILYTGALFALRLLLAAGYIGPYSAFLLPLPLILAAAGLYRAADRAAPALGSALPGLATGALVVFGLYRCADLAKIFRHDQWARVATPAGAVWLTEPVASTTREALQDLSARVPAGGLLVGFPEGGFFDYVLKLRNPLPQDQFFPGHLDARAEADAIALLSRRPPDAILIANVLAVGHGSVRFGRDYLPDLDRFLRANFDAAAAYGPGAGAAPRVGDPQFFVEIRVPRRAAAP